MNFFVRYNLFFHNFGISYKKFFQETFQLGLDIWEKTLHNIGRPLFSMGMSGSFEIAIEEGADMVRVGRALFAEPMENT